MPTAAELKESLVNNDKTENFVAADRATQIAEMKQLGLEHWIELTGHHVGQCYGSYRVNELGVLKQTPDAQRLYATAHVTFQITAPPSCLLSKVPRNGLPFPSEPPELLGFALSLNGQVQIPPEFQRRVIEIAFNDSRDAFLRWRCKNHDMHNSSMVADDEYIEAWSEMTDETLHELRNRLSDAEKVIPTDTGTSLNEKFACVADLRRQVEEAERSQTAYKAQPHPSAVREGVPTSGIRDAFGHGLAGKNEEWFAMALGDPRKQPGLIECRVGVTRPRQEARWNPVLVADWLIQKKRLSPSTATLRIREHFPTWLQEWEENKATYG
jgi:hypothetical protein